MRTTGVPRYHLNSFLNHEGHPSTTLRTGSGAPGLKNALYDWLTPVHAVTGIPVLVYFPMDFFSNNSDDFGIVSLRMLPPRFRSPASFSIRLRDAYYS